MKRRYGVAVLLAAFGLYAAGYVMETGQRRAEASYALAVSHMPGAGALRYDRGAADSAASLSPRDAYYHLIRCVVYERAIATPFRSPALWKSQLRHAGPSLDVCVREIGLALALNPFDALLHHNAGWLLYAAGRDGEALDSLRRAAELEHDTSLYHVSLGIVAEALGRRPESQAEFRRAIAMDPSLVASEWFRQRAGDCPEEMARLLREATADVEAEVSALPGGLAESRLAKLYFHQARLGEALPMIGHVVSRLPRLPRPWILLGDVLRMEGQESGMERAYLGAIAVSNGLSDPAPYYYLAELAERRGRLREARRLYLTALSFSRRRPFSHAYLSRLFYRVGDALPDDVVPNGLFGYCEPGPDAPEIYANLAAMCRGSGQPAAAAAYGELSRNELALRSAAEQGPAACRE